MIYARVIDGQVIEVIPPAFYEDSGEEIPIALRFHPDFVLTLIEIPDGKIVSPGDSYDGGEFGDPKPPSMTPEQVIDFNASILRTSKLSASTHKKALDSRISVLRDAIEYGIATANEDKELPLREAQRKEWGVYAVELDRVSAQASWPQSPLWPEKPAEPANLDLYVAADSASRK